MYKVKSDVGFPDPHMPPGRLHHSIFVQTTEDGSGINYEVTGDITSMGGMTYQSKPAEDPTTLDTFQSREFLGHTSAANQETNWENVLSSLPTPPQQKAANLAKMGQVEPFKERLASGGFVFYKDGEERRPLWKCTEWVEQYAIPTLLDKGLIKLKGNSE